MEKHHYLYLLLLTFIWLGCDRYQEVIPLPQVPPISVSKLATFGGNPILMVEFQQQIGETITDSIQLLVTNQTQSNLDSVKLYLDFFNQSNQLVDNFEFRWCGLLKNLVVGVTDTITINNTSNVVIAAERCNVILLSVNESSGVGSTYTGDYQGYASDGSVLTLEELGSLIGYISDDGALKFYINSASNAELIQGQMLIDSLSFVGEVVGMTNNVLATIKSTDTSAITFESDSLLINFQLNQKLVSTNVELVHLSLAKSNL